MKSAAVAKRLGKSPAFFGLMIVMVGVLSGCAHHSKQTQVAPTPGSPPQETSPYIADRAFTSDTLYALLVAELAGGRQDLPTMLTQYLTQAKQTQDLLVIQRAAQLADYLKQPKPTQEMVDLWLHIEPENLEAHQLALKALADQNQLKQALPHARYLLHHQQESYLDALAARAVTAPGDLATDLLPDYLNLLNQYPEQLELLIGTSLLQQKIGHYEEALILTRRILLKTPNDKRAYAQETQLLTQLGRTQETEQRLLAAVQQFPDNQEFRLQYARFLLKGRTNEAKKQFEILVTQAPKNPNYTLALALIDLDLKDYNSAQVRLQNLLTMPGYSSSANYYLGHLALIQKQSDAALVYFSRVEPGPDYVTAAHQWVNLMMRQGSGDQALKQIQLKRQQIPPYYLDNIEGLYLLESLILSDQNALTHALAPLNEGLTKLPKSTRLLHARGMLQARLDRLDKAEQDFKAVLALEPEHTATLNAWGYTLADRTPRLEEAYQFIREAYRLNPKDPAIIDSLGWVEFKRGNIELALKNLRSAMEMMPDAEIAAHLGEVLWLTGAQEEAKKVWKRGLAIQPQSPMIIEALKRLKVP